jgi:hypothetical protein
LTSQSTSTFISGSPAAVGSGTTDSQKLMPEMKMLGLHEEGAYKRKHLGHKLKNWYYWMHFI